MAATKIFDKLLFAVLAVGSTLMCAFPAAASAPEIQQQTKDVKSYTIDTDLIRPYKSGETGREVVVVTPPGYFDPINKDQRYPVIYLLHGSPGNPWNFVRFGFWNVETAKLVDQNQIIPPILVAADGNYAMEKHGDCEWVNSADGKDKFSDYLCKDVVGWADSHFRTIPNPTARIVGGVSEGAYGAVNIALRHPDVFGNVLALSGYYVNDGSGWGRPIMGSDPKYIEANSPLTYLKADPKSLPPGWKRTRFFLGAGDTENRYTDETKQLDTILTHDGVDVTMQILNGKHGWLLWNQLYVDGAKVLLPRTPAKPPSAPIHAGGVEGQ